MSKLQQLKLSCPYTWGLQELVQNPTALCTDFMEFESLAVPEITFMVRLIRWLQVGVRTNDVEMMQQAEAALQVIYQNKKTSGLGRAAEHVFHATQLYFYEAHGPPAVLERKLLQGESEQWRHDFSKLSGFEQAMIDGWKSYALSLFPLQRLDEGIALVQRAIAAQPANALWHFVHGHYLRKKRRSINHRSSPCSLELSCFTRAAQLSENPLYHVYAIQSKQEASFSSPSRHHEMVKIERAYTKLLAECDCSTLLMLKVALGLIRCKYKDLDVVHAVLDRVDALSPNNLTCYHYRSMAYRNEGRKELALHYLKLASGKQNFITDSVYLNHLLKSSSTKEAIDFSLTMLERFRNSPPDRLQEILLNIAFMYHTTGDSKSAAKYFLEAIETLPSSGRLCVPYVFSGIEVKGAYKFLRHIFLPPINVEITADCEFFVTVQELKRYCDLDIQRRMFPRGPGH